MLNNNCYKYGIDSKIPENKNIPEDKFLKIKQMSSPNILLNLLQVVNTNATTFLQNLASSISP